MAEKEWVFHTPNDITTFIDAFSQAVGEKKILLFEAPMGAGKTTFIKAFCRFKGVESEVSSPTYSIVQEYKCGDHKIFHFDLYRVQSVEELYEIGIEDYLFSGNMCLVEWPELLKAILHTEEYRTIQIQILENKDRKLLIL